LHGSVFVVKLKKELKETGCLIRVLRSEDIYSSAIVLNVCGMDIWTEKRWNREISDSTLFKTRIGLNPIYFPDQTTAGLLEQKAERGHCW